MEFIQWKTGGSTSSGRLMKDSMSHHALFRLDSMDVELMDKDKLFELRNAEAKEAAENGIRISKSFPCGRVSEDDEKTYKCECVKLFAELLGINLADIEK